MKLLLISIDCISKNAGRTKLGAKTLSKSKKNKKNLKKILKIRKNFKFEFKDIPEKVGMKLSLISIDCISKNAGLTK